MKLTVQASKLKGAVNTPGSKSHTIRAVAIAALAKGRSAIHSPLDSADARAAFQAYRAMGATIHEEGSTWYVDGTGGKISAPDDCIDVANSGTTMRLALGSAALIKEGSVVLTGDGQVRSRPCGPLVQSLNDLGATTVSTRRNGMAPFVVEGTLSGGETSIEAVTSQYLSSLLINAPLAEHDTRIHVPLLNEKPYVTITLYWLDRQGIQLEYEEDYSEFLVRGGQTYGAYECHVPADFSSATFFLAAGALSENEVLCRGLDMDDSQGDKAVLEYLKAMGARVRVEDNGIRVTANSLKGCEIDLNATPDALPMMAVLSCFAEGTTRLVNVPQARLKETDRIAVMREELEKMGARVTELEDGMVIEGTALHATEVDGHDDHRVVMALAIAGTQLEGATTIQGYEAVNVTFPGFLECLEGMGGVARVTE